MSAAAYHLFGAARADRSIDNEPSIPVLINDECGVVEGNMARSCSLPCSSLAVNQETALLLALSLNIGAIPQMTESGGPQAQERLA